MRTATAFLHPRAILGHHARRGDRLDTPGKVPRRTSPADHGKLGRSDLARSDSAWSTSDNGKYWRTRLARTGANARQRGGRGRAGVRHRRPNGTRPARCGLHRCHSEPSGLYADHGEPDRGDRGWCAACQGVRGADGCGTCRHRLAPMVAVAARPAQDRCLPDCAGRARIDASQPRLASTTSTTFAAPRGS